MVTSVSISPDDRLVITASGDGTAQAERIGDRALRTFPRVNPVQLSPTAGGFEAIASPGPGPGEGIVIERYSDAGRVVGAPLVMSHQTQPLEMSLSPDGTLATNALGAPSAQSGPMPEWNVPGRRVVRTITFPNGPPGAPVISPTDRLLVIPGPGPLQGFPTPGPPGSVTSSFYKPAVLIDLRTGRQRTLAAPTTPSPWWVFAFSRTGAAVAAGSVSGQVGVWDTVTGRKLGRLIQISGNPTALALSPDGRSLVVASSNGTVDIARVPLTPPTHSLHASTQSVQGVAYSPNGRYLATVGQDRTATVYDAHSLAELRVIQLPQPGQGVAFTTDSRGLLLWDTTGTVTLWDACTDCENPSALVSLARNRVTRPLTPPERQEFGVR
jgi:WD40 repeat protein